MTMRSFSFLAGLSLATLTGSLAAAEYTVGLSGFTTGEADLGDGAGDLRTDEYGLSVDVSAGNYREGGLLAVNGGYNRRTYSIDAFGNSVSAEDDFETLSTSVRYGRHIEGNWGMTGLLGLSFAQGDEGDWGEGMTFFGAALADYSFSRDLTVSFGLAYMSRLGEDDLIIPLAAVRWQINDRWSLQTFDGVYVQYAVTPDKSQLLDLFASWQSETYSVGSIAGKELYLEDEGFVLGVRYHVNVGENFVVSPYAGYLFSREFEVRNEDDNRLAKLDADSTWVLGLSLSGKF